MDLMKVCFIEGNHHAEFHNYHLNFAYVHIAAVNALLDIDALLPLLSNFSFEYAIRKVQ
jgi:hypothetical protein